MISPPSDIDVDPELMRQTVARYVQGLENTDFEQVADCFAEDAFYSHPPFEPDGPRGEAKGRAAVLALLVNHRGERSWVHEVQSFMTGNNHCVIEGIARESEDGPIALSFAGVGTFDEAGRITRWVSYRSVPHIGAALEADS